MGSTRMRGERLGSVPSAGYAPAPGAASAAAGWVGGALRFVCVLLLGLVAAGCARAPVPAEAPPAANAALPLLYEVEAGGRVRAHLLGSVHLGRPDDWRVPPRVAGAMAQADLLVLELDLRRVGPEELGAVVWQLGRLPPGRRLRDVLSPETWALLRARAGEAGLTPAELQGLEPWVVALRFVALAFERAGFEAEQGVERLLIARWSPAKEIHGLETAREQIGLFDGLPLAVQELMLRDALRPTDETASELDALVQAWRRGDAEAIERVIFAPLAEQPELAPFYEATFFARNARMADGIAALLRGDSRQLFVVLGAGHLVGERGVPALLARAGFGVRQLQR